MIDVCICDDNREDIEKYIKYIDEYRQGNPALYLRVRTFVSPNELLEYIKKYGGFDMYLLDIVMPDITGIKLAEEIRKSQKKSEIVFLTISRDYAVEAYGVKASGYLLKPVVKNDFFEIISICIERILLYKEQIIMLKTNEGIRKIDVNMLVMIESFNHTRILFFADGTSVKTSVMLTELFDKLKNFKRFYMPHRSYIINIDYVTGIKKSSILISTGIEIPVAKSRQNVIKSAFIDYFFDSSKE